jgi:hypothetical protein
MAVGYGDGEQGVRALFGFEVADDDRETVFLVEDQAGDLEELVGHLALLHRAAEDFELRVIREESAGDDGTEDRFVLETRRAAVIATTIIAARSTWAITTGATGSGTRAVTTRATALSAAGRATTVAARSVTETRAIAIAAGAAVAGAYLLRGSTDPGGPETKGREVQFKGLFLGRVVFGRVGGH